MSQTPRESIPAAAALRRMALELLEALPAILLAAALMMPALAAFAESDRVAGGPPDELALAIADQGNRALLEIVEQSRQTLRQMAAPQLPPPAPESITVATREPAHP